MATASLPWISMYMCCNWEVVYASLPTESAVLPVILADFVDAVMSLVCGSSTPAFLWEQYFSSRILAASRARVATPTTTPAEMPAVVRIVLVAGAGVSAGLKGTVCVEV